MFKKLASKWTIGNDILIDKKRGRVSARSIFSSMNKITFTRSTILVYQIEPRTFDFHNQPVDPFSEGKEGVWVDVVSPPWEWNAQDDDKKPFLSSVVSSQEAEQ